MSRRTWVYADPHFFHDNICKFTRYDGDPLRPWDNADEMSEWMIDEYNKLVSPEDRVYILGDVAMNRRALDRSVPRLNGRKVLVKGNHDEDKLSYYSQYFDDIRAYVVKKNFVMSHIPIHEQSLSRWGVNIHGHLHNNRIMINDKFGNSVVDPRYICASVEHTDYKPILLDKLLGFVK